MTNPRPIRKQTLGRHGDLQGGYLVSRGTVVELGAEGIFDRADFSVTHPFISKVGAFSQAPYGPIVEQGFIGAGGPARTAFNVEHSHATQRSRAGAFLVRR